MHTQDLTGRSKVIVAGALVLALLLLASLIKDGVTKVVQTDEYVSMPGWSRSGDEQHIVDANQAAAKRALQSNLASAKQGCRMLTVRTAGEDISIRLPLGSKAYLIESNAGFMPCFGFGDTSAVGKYDRLTAMTVVAMSLDGKPVSGPIRLANKIKAGKVNRGLTLPGYVRVWYK